MVDLPQTAPRQPLNMSGRGFVRKRRKAYVMGGSMLKMLTLVNAVSPSAADTIGLRRFGKLIKQHSPR